MRQPAKRLLLAFGALAFLAGAYIWFTRSADFQESRFYTGGTSSLRGFTLSE